MKVRVLKLDERYAEFATEEEKQLIGEVFEAVKYNDYNAPDEKYQEMYVMPFEYGFLHLPAFCCEVVEEGTINPDAQEMQHTNFGKDILLVEDGSVDINKLEADGFYVIVYRQGSTPPMRIK